MFLCLACAGTDDEVTTLVALSLPPPPPPDEEDEAVTASPMACFNVVMEAAAAADLRHRIMIKMAATVKTMPPITADKMMISGKDSVEEEQQCRVM